MLSSRLKPTVHLADTYRRRPRRRKVPFVLRRADNVHVTYDPSLFTGKGWVLLHVGRRTYRAAKIHKSRYRAAQEQQQHHPVSVASVEHRTYWHFQGRFYWADTHLDADQVYALLTTRQQRETQRIERAQAIVAMGSTPRPPARRTAIPDDVKQLVWIRDGGKCRHCGAVSELQFDHVIPVAMGGGNAPENLQVLCGPCNRSKSAGLTVRR